MTFEPDKHYFGIDRGKPELVFCVIVKVLGITDDNELDVIITKVLVKCGVYKDERHIVPDFELHEVPLTTLQKEVYGV